MTEPIELLEYDPSWPARFEAERTRLLEALGGWAWETGGVAYLIEHIGSTSVPGLAAKPCIDITAGVHPFPLEERYIRALEGLGYEYKGENNIPARQYFRRGPHQVHLHVFQAGADPIADFSVFRDYLRANPAARARYQALKYELAGKYRDDRIAYTYGKASLVHELLQEAYTWHVRQTGFGPVEWLARELEGLEVPWWVASGWGLDLWTGEPSRYHHDLDLTVWRKDQREILLHLREQGFNLQVVYGQGQYRPWDENEWLSYPEVTQVHARRADMPFDLLDVMFSEHHEQNWWYRRKPEITMPMEEVILEARGIRVMNPAITLLFKSRTSGKDPRPKDQADFERVLPLLSAEQRAWVRRALEIWMPEHPWLLSLE